MAEWQTIEAAPKGAVTVLAWAEGWPHPATVRWRSEWDAWQCDAVGFAVGAKLPLPTHWMPLPEPPNGQ